MTESSALHATDADGTPFVPLSPEQGALFALSPLPVLVLDGNFRIRFVNEASAALGKVDATTLIGQNVWQRYPELQGSIFQQAYAAVLREQKAQHFEEYSAATDSWNSVFAYPGDGGVVAILDDVTTQRRAERALRDSEAALARAQELASIGSWVWTLPSTLTWSAEIFRILGVDPATTPPDFDLIRDRLVSDDERTAWTDAVRELRYGRDFEMQLSVRRDDGAIVVVVVLARVSLAPGGATARVFGTLQDLTERLRTVEALRRSEKTLRLAQEAANIGSFDRDLRTGQTRWSDQLIRIVGLDPANYEYNEIVDAEQHQFVHPDDRIRLRRAWRRAIATGEKQVLRHRIIRRDGDERHLLSYAMLVRNAKGEPSRLVGTALDITDQVRAEEEQAKLQSQIQQAQKLESLGVLAGGIAHDFNNLLVGILGNASLALLDLELESPARRSVEEIEQAAQRAADLTRQLLAYAGKGRFVIETVDTSLVVSEMASLLRTAVHRNATMHLDLPVTLPSIEVDSTQFRQVVMNLITNASDALNESEGVISIRTGVQHLGAEQLLACVQVTDASPGEFVFIEVRDSGSGIEAELLPRIFDPFYSTKFTGRGLGLAATLGIMRGHGGAIRVTSDVGIGTIFTLFFPASLQRARVEERPQGSGWRSHGRVLVVDDEASVRAVTRALLQRRGFVVDEAEDGHEALRKFERAPDSYSLIMLDLTMPGLGGEETFRALRARKHDVCVLLMSGYDEQELSQRFVGSGLAGFLQKPFRADDLYTTIARTIDVRAIDFY